MATARVQVLRDGKVRVTKSTESAAVWPMGPFPVITSSILREGLDSKHFYRIVANTDLPEFSSYVYENRNGSGVYISDAYFVRGFRLGPYGSRWVINYIMDEGPDCGIAKFQWSTGIEDAPNEGFAVPDGLLDSPYNIAGNNDPLGQDYEQQVDAFTQDCYNASDTPGGIRIAGPAEGADFRIKGADGDTLTIYSNPFSDPDPDLSGVSYTDGGAGIWWLTVSCAGKHASSSDYRITIRDMWVVRLTWDGFPA